MCHQSLYCQALRQLWLKAPGRAGRRMMDAPERTPLHWLRAFAELLDQSACSCQGAEASLEQGLEALIQIWAEQRRADRSVYWIGNGGSAALVSHLAQDLLNKGKVRSRTFNDAPLITCMSNDYGYREVFKRPLLTLAREGDALMAVSSSGMSENIVEAARAALDAGLTLVTLSAFSPDNHLRGLPAALSFHTPTKNYGHAELAHGALLHSALDCFERSSAQ